MATNSEKVAFLSNLSLTLSNYSTKLSKKERLGICNEKFKFRHFLLSAYYDILVDYVNVVDDTDENFFTVSEARDILEHFNRIADSNISYTDFE